MDLPKIGGRECLPVRLLPFLTGWRPLSPDNIARIFAGHDRSRPWPTNSFRIGEDGIRGPIERRNWKTVECDLGDLAKKLRRRGVEHAEWRAKSLKILPPGVFVWKDEFQLLYERTVRPTRVRFIDVVPVVSKSGANVANEVFVDEEEGRLNFDPDLLPSEATLVWEGFESLRPTAAATSVQATSVDLEAMRAMRNDGKTDKEIGSAYGRSRGWVWKKIGSKQGERIAGAEIARNTRR